MSLLIFSYRRLDILARKSTLNFKLNQLNKKLMDLQSYSASIADGVVSLEDLTKAPASMFGNMMSFAQRSSMSAYQQAQQQFGSVWAMSQPGIQASMSQVQPELQQQYMAYQQKMIFKNLYDQAKQKSSDAEQKLLDVQDRKIEQEKAQIETQLKMLEAEEEKVTKAEEDGAKKSAPSYVA